MGVCLVSFDLVAFGVRLPEGSPLTHPLFSQTEVHPSCLRLRTSSLVLVTN